MDRTADRPNIRATRVDLGHGDWLGPSGGRVAAVAAVAWLAFARGGDSEPAGRLAPCEPSPAVATRTVGAVVSAPPAATPGRPDSCRDRSDRAAIDQARAIIEGCHDRFAQVDDYTCTFLKRERVDGRLYDQHEMRMKARTAPSSLYFKFVRPNAGREAIYVHGQNDGKILAHDVGLGRLLAGTMRLDPRGSMAMEENRHPVTEAGLGALIATIRRCWATELQPGESRVTIDPQARLGDRPCTVVETVHPRPSPDYVFHKVRLYVDPALGIPVRFEGYDWPAAAGSEAELVEEYTYADLRLNVGMKACDFDPTNPAYSFGRF